MDFLYRFTDASLQAPDLSARKGPQINNDRLAATSLDWLYLLLHTGILCFFSGTPDRCIWLLFRASFRTYPFWLRRRFWFRRCFRGPLRHTGLRRTLRRGA